VSRIEEAFLDPASPDRLDAVETLAKLRVAVSGETRATALRLASEWPESDAIFARWALAVAGEPGELERITGSLSSADALARLRAAYALRWLQPAAPATLAALARAADAEPVGSEAHVYLVSAALVLEANPGRLATWQEALEGILATGTAGARYEALQALMLRYGSSDIPRLLPLLDDADSDTRTGAAWAILRIDAQARTGKPR
jgi:HEAT repeat protein